MVARLEARATRHYFDSAFQSQAVKVLPNEYYVTDEDIMLSLIHISCSRMMASDMPVLP